MGVNVQPYRQYGNHGAHLLLPAPLTPYNATPRYATLLIRVGFMNERRTCPCSRVLVVVCGGNLTGVTVTRYAASSLFESVEHSLSRWYVSLPACMSAHHHQLDKFFGPFASVKAYLHTNMRAPASVSSNCPVEHRDYVAFTKELFRGETHSAPAVQSTSSATSDQ